MTLPKRVDNRDPKDKKMKLLQDFAMCIVTACNMHEPETKRALEKHEH